MIYTQALNIATSKVELLKPYCTIIHIAGSIRRENMNVKDIEIVALPKAKVSSDLFGTTDTGERDDGFISVANCLGRIIKGTATGRYMHIQLAEGIMLDLFIPQRDDYFRQLAIRTGSSDYSFKVVATAWRRMGWVGTDKGLRRIEECTESKYTPPGGKPKSKWTCHSSNPTLPPAWKTEEQFFNFIGVKCVHPRYRKI